MRWAERIAIGPICGDGRRRRPRPRCGRRAHPRCSTAVHCSCPTVARSPARPAVATSPVPGPQSPVRSPQSPVRQSPACAGAHARWADARGPRPGAGGGAAGLGGLGRWDDLVGRRVAAGPAAGHRPIACTGGGRPDRRRSAGPSTRRRGGGRRLALLADIVTGGTQVPAPVLAGVVHGELLTLEPFGTADGVVARAVSRLVTIASGLDPHGLGVPEVYWMRYSGDYRAAARGFSSGTPDGLAAWLVLSARALHAGAREALTIAQTLSVTSSRRRPSNAKRATLRTDSARRPLARTPVTMRALCGLRGWPRRLVDALRLQPRPKGPSWSSALRNYAGPQHFYLFRGMCSAWVPGSVLGSLARETEPSLPARSWPPQASVVPLYSVTAVTSRPKLRATRDRYTAVPASYYTK